IIPDEYSLEQNYPNPFNPTTTIRYDLPKDGLVQLEIFDIIGRKITTLVNSHQSAGRYEVNLPVVFTSINYNPVSTFLLKR
ncbi:MAG TPA: hypothetical protein PK073_07830, partial [Ignavibacteriaceae bacterium]|nr:hypothetical protein [Ignavibacteriaceae bacterium]